MYDNETELKLIEQINKMDIDELKELALKTLIAREKTKLRNQKLRNKKKKGRDNDEVQ